ncbi:unnamed protein product [Ectocarpus sp. 4 AP-2014]
MESRSLVEICGTYRTKCGYCKPDTKTSVSYGLLAKRLTCADYQELIDRGWRRSGTFVYKPVMHETCCPQYTIRLDVTRFKHTKGQRHVLNRLRRYLDGDKDAASSTDAANGQRDAGGGSNSSNGATTERKKKRNLPQDAQREKGVSRNGDARRENPERLGALSEHIAAAALAAMESGAVPGLGFEPEWRSEVLGWSQVRPIRNKNVLASGGGFCSTVALRIASAARKQGWHGVGGGGGAAAIAEATAEKLRVAASGGDKGPVLSAIAVAPNGFINFEAGFAPSFTSASQNHAQLPPPNALLQARASGSPTPPATPPSPPTPGSALPPNIPPVGGASVRGAVASRSTVKPTPMEGGRPEGGDSSSGSETTGGDVNPAKAVLNSSGEAAALPAEGVRLGHTRTTTGHEGDGAFTPAAAVARMEWIERQGNNEGAMDVEAAAALKGFTPQAPPGSESRTGLASLPRLDPAVESHRMTVSTVPARMTDEVFRLYVKYQQVSVHGDDPSEVTPDQFRRFLVDSPLIREPIGGASVRRRKPSFRRGSTGGSPFHVGDCGVEGNDEDESSEVTEGRDSLAVPYGSYHQLYRIDGKLVAVGVVDVLPKCLSSVYCFYDPDYRALALGKLTALKETEFIREASVVRPALRDYYMGFYIHTCPKMSYKGSYTPSFLLCPERLTWVPLELCRPVLDVHKYACLSSLLASPVPAAHPSLVISGSDAGVGNGTQRRRSGSMGSVGGGFGSSVRPADGGRFPQRDVADSEGARGSRATGQTSPSSGSYSPLSSLSPDRREVGRGRSRNVYSSSARSTQAGESAATSRFGRETHGEVMGIAAAAAAARRFAAERAAAARAAQAAADEATGINDIPLMVGQPSFPVNFSALTPHSQALVRDVLSTYVATVGSDLAKKVVLKLHG